jgi:drug/metabolite transporter (DMT)-like permease
VRLRGGWRSTDAILLLTVVIWALNISATKYILTHGFRPLAYASVRYGLAAVLFAGLTFALERTLAIGGRRSLGLVALAVLFIWGNQVAFVYSLKLTTATTVALILGTTPIFAALFASATGLERLTRRFWAALALSFAGVACVAVGSGGELSGHLGGVLLAVLLSVTWAGYSVSVAPLMRRYSPYRISAVVLLIMWIPLAAISAWQLGDQDYAALDWSVWFLLAFAVLGPLVLTNVLWFTAVHRVGPSHATLFANLNPFVAALFAVVLLSEPLSVLQVLGGAAIALGILLAGRLRTVAAPSE